jgi:uncharacterized protein (DUF2062 family)
MHPNEYLRKGLPLMPRKTVRRFIPDVKAVLETPTLGHFKTRINNSNLLNINRHSVSLAVYSGVFCAFLPIPGQTVLALLMCYWLGANLPIAAICIWISNPITIPPMFYLTYRLGSRLLGTEPIALKISFSVEWLMELSNQVLLPLLVGSVLIGITLATVGYLMVLQLWRWKVVQNWEKRRGMRRDISS